MSNKVKLSEGKYLFYKLNINTPKIDIKKLFHMDNSKGYMVKENQLETWLFKGLHQENNDYFLYGPAFEGRALYEILQLEKDDAIKYIIKLVDALDLLMKNNVNLELHLNTVYFNTDGSILFLPSETIQTFLPFFKDNYKYNNFSLINNPYCKSTIERINYSVFALLYKIFTNRFPFESEDENELSNKIMYKKFVKPEIYNPKLKKQFSNFIFKSIKLTSNFQMASIGNSLKKYQENGFEEKLTDEEVKKQENKNLKKLEKYHNRNKVFDKIKKHFKKALLIIIGAIVIITTSYLIVKNVFFPNKMTKGYTAQKVVKAYYNSFNSLNHPLMTDCVVGKAGKDDIEQVIRFHIIDKTVYAEAQRPHSNMIQADRWEKMGKPEIIHPQYIYGVLDLNIQEVESGETPVFIATYSKWEPKRDEQFEIENPGKAKIISIEKKTEDKLYLKQKHGYWVIYKLDRLKEEIIN